jgi:23S rRNA pseudouridine2605 synthase/23S rRNA pseudouridine2604 synthase
MSLIRLTKRLALTGLYSRHEADKLVANSHVTVDGVLAIPGTKVSEDGNEQICVDGEPIAAAISGIYKFYKPRGVLSSYGDPHGKRDLSHFPELAKMKLGYSGRLDYDSEGLMLFTSDGGLVYKLQRSEFKVEKEYRVDTSRDITPDWLAKLRTGICVDGEQFLPCVVERLDTCKYRVILTEGKKRQVRKMFHAACSHVERLVRVRIGTVELGDLRPSTLVRLSDDEERELRACIALP